MNVTLPKAENGSHRCLSSMAVANFFLRKSYQEKQPITMLKLIKLVYIAHGWCLATTDEPLFDEEVQAWKLGPVVPSLYHEFKRYGYSPIKEFGSEWDDEKDEFFYPDIPKDQTQTMKLLQKVWDVYKPFTSGQLIQLTHQEGTPWATCYIPGVRNQTISNYVIADYYRKALAGLVKNPRAKQFNNDA